MNLIAAYAGFYWVTALNDAEMALKGQFGL
jgi:hypothetical protein